MSNYTETVCPSRENAAAFTDEGEPCRRFKWVVEIEVDETWVADGFDLTQERLHSMLMHDLSFARESEVACKILQTPDPKLIRDAQGYQD